MQNFDKDEFLEWTEEQAAKGAKVYVSEAMMPEGWKKVKDTDRQGNPVDENAYLLLEKVKLNR